MGLDNLSSGIMEFVEEHPIGTAVGAGAAAIGGGILVASVIGAKTKARNRRARTKKGISRDRKFISKQKWERNRKRKTKGKRYKTKSSRRNRTTKSKKGLHYTKNGQPYKILANGRARFVKKTKRRSK